MQSENEFCIKPDGSIEIPINPEGLPLATGIMPTIRYKPEERLRKVLEVLDGYALRGYWIDSWKWIKNPVFDKKGEKTSVQITYRVCKNKDEALILLENIKKSSVNWDYNMEDRFGEFHNFTGHEEKGHCFWCGEKLPKNRGRYCCKQHAHLYLTFFHWNEACTNVYRRIYDPYKGNRCEKCGNYFVRWESGIQVHHIIPLSGEDRNWNVKNRPENLLGLCKDCHKETHRVLFQSRVEQKGLIIRRQELEIQPELF